MNINLNAKFGDGCISLLRSGNYQLSFSSTNQSLIRYKATLLGSNVRPRKQSPKAYGSKDLWYTVKTVPGFDLDVGLLIEQITIEDFILWLLDDGSYHKRAGFMNLCSHALSRSENILLSFHLWHSLGIESRVIYEKKRDGRIFWYLYIPPAQVDSIKPDIKRFMVVNSITGLEYKIGEPSQTIETEKE